MDCRKKIGVRIIIVLIGLSFCLCLKTQEHLIDYMKENVYLSYASQCKRKYIDAWNCFWCKKMKESYSNVFTSEETKLGLFFYTVIQNDHTLIIDFRGSVPFGMETIKNIINWIMNMEFALTSLPFAPFPNIKVHSGFLKCFQEIQKMVIDRIEYVVDNFQNVDEILVLGHSLGSSLGILSTAYIYQTNTNKKIKNIIDSGKFKVFSIGQPRIGNTEFYEYFANFSTISIMRVVNQRDPVPALPFRSWGYHQLPVEYFFRNDTENYVKCDGSGEDPTCGDSLHIRFTARDHDTYLGIDIMDAIEFCDKD